MTFEELLEKDIMNTFSNTNEFAGVHLWNNIEIIATVDDEILMRKYSSEFDALGQGSHMVYASRKQFGRIPVINDSISFDGSIYIVDEVKNIDGMLAIFLRNGRG